MTRLHSTTLRQPAGTQHGLGTSGILVRFWDTVLQWQERARSRYVLSLMDEAALKDIGLSRSMAESEINKPFWRI